MTDHREATQFPGGSAERVQGRIHHVLDAPAPEADHMVVRRRIGFEPDSAILSASDGEQVAPFAQRTQGLVHGVQRDHGELPTHPLVDLLHRGMTCAPGQGLEDRHPLGGNPQPIGTQAAGNGLLGSHRGSGPKGVSHEYPRLECISNLYYMSVIYA